MKLLVLFNPILCYMLRYAILYATLQCPVQCSVLWYYHLYDDGYSAVLCALVYMVYGAMYISYIYICCVYMYVVFAVI
jgi:hypothetical protein